MKILLISALVAVALCQTRVVEAAPAWNGWNGWNGQAYNGWNGWNNGYWPAQETVIETVAPAASWNPAWGGQAWGTPAWGNQAWNPAWGVQGARPYGWDNYAWAGNQRWVAPVAAAATNTTAAANKK